MAYTQVNAVSPSLTGAAIAYAAPAGAGAGNGDAIPVGAKLLVKNGSGASITLTLNIPRTYQGYTISSPTVSVAAGAEVVIGPFPADPFGVTSGTDIDRVHVDYSSITSVTRVVLG